MVIRSVLKQAAILVIGLEITAWLFGLGGLWWQLLLVSSISSLLIIGLQYNLYYFRLLLAWVLVGHGKFFKLKLSRVMNKIMKRKAENKSTGEITSELHRRTFRRSRVGVVREAEQIALMAYRKHNRNRFE